MSETMKYTKDHEWIKVDGDSATVGISPYAAGQLGDVVYVELPDIDHELDLGDEACVVESVKAASEVYAPVAGTVTEVNGALEDAPETVNADAAGEGWFFKMTISEPEQLDGLMDEAAYKEYVEGLD